MKANILCLIEYVVQYIFQAGLIPRSNQSKNLRRPMISTDHRSLQLFLVLAEELHFGRAAARLNMSQPPLSKHIQRMEEELGVRLFERDQRNVRITSAGAAFVRQANQLLAQSARAVRAIQQIARGETGQIRIGFVAAAIFLKIDRLFQSIEQQVPGIEIMWQEMSTSEQVEAVALDRIDLGIAQRPQVSDMMGSQMVASVPLVAALPENHPLAQEAGVHLWQLAKDPFIMLPRTPAPGFHDLIIATCFKAGISPTICHYAKHLLSAVSLVAMGRGVSLVPQTLARATLPGVIFMPMKGEPSYAEYSVIWNTRNALPILPRVLEVLAATVKPEEYLS
jgi:DNA-binding transcriptional LysR family regulator